MKSPAFDYVRATSAQQALALLAQHGDDARLLAGGQTLLATLNLRLSRPALLVDIGGLHALAGISLQGGTLRIGALTKHVEIEESPLVAQYAPLLAQAAPHIAHRAIRNLGTFGGALAHADPAAEWPACVLALGATLVLQGVNGERRVAVADFFRGVYTTARRDDELLGLRDSAAGSGRTTAFQRVGAPPRRLCHRGPGRLRSRWQRQWRRRVD